MGYFYSPSDILRVRRSKSTQTLAFCPGLRNR